MGRGSADRSLRQVEKIIAHVSVPSYAAPIPTWSSPATRRMCWRCSAKQKYHCIDFPVWNVIGLNKLHTEKSFRNLIKSYRNQIVFTMHRLIWNKTDVRLAPNHSENGKYNLLSVLFNKILKRFLCVY